jgi:hypothetical protein
MVKTSKVAAGKNASNKRTLIEPNDDKRYVRRNNQGQFKEIDDVGKSLSQDIRKASAVTVKAGQGNQGDQARKKGSQR